ncbi:hypothetical protein HELRODRAFT_88588 [Helobdella robusta]|uniref:LIM zinc-binding domain-containing protein n=1 Tax=Helobdella robusta TaxID=6412 RepID=T1G741_HELRO|nr:hypothetical protein HELRODRAFT_88588 [Helobdella robusta]ESN93541.1 hypothetical protein HELRODRAFT_88588 [Helobdella robusta]
MGKLYHTSCFYCSICNKSLRGKVFYDVKGTIYCEEDYKKSGYKQLSEVCKACSRLILDVVVQAAGHAYHTGCFKCSQCQSSLQDQNFIIDSKNTLLCVDDYYKIHSMECAACKRLIKPADGSNEVGKVMVMNKSYHADCLACSDCKKKLGTGSDSGCYPLNEDTIFCKMCYNKRKPS